MALLGTAEGGELLNEKAISAAQSAFYFLENAHQHIA